MNNQLVSDRPAGKVKTTWVRVLLILFIIEKIIQHTFVTLAFYFNWKGIGSTVVIDPGILMVLGGTIGLLFILSLWAMITAEVGHKPRACFGLI